MGPGKGKDGRSADVTNSGTGTEDTARRLGQRTVVLDRETWRHIQSPHQTAGVTRPATQQRLVPTSHNNTREIIN